MAELVTREEPSVGEVVIGVVKTVEKYGAYINLLDYPGWEGFTHVSEISLKWIRNIRDYLREGQKEVFKILRVNPHLHQVDLSLRRVEKKEREQKLLDWKRREKVLRVINLLAEKTGIKIDELKKMIVEPVSQRGLRLYDVFLDLMESETIPEWLKLDENIVGKLIEIIKQEIKMKKVVLRGELILSCKRGDGVEHIRKAIEEGLKLAGRGEIVSITTKGSPRYLIRVEADVEERARELLEEVANRCISVIRESGGKGELIRE
ncbi:MAG: S1 RNA-binding domain-containing protein [Aigarchaeota archaeon]|nr:S1 RNA-binding domain-containing protein [Aigarchaeota archaeon]MCX8193313.1 S1 RNA-binding domain-containing protein [Nitrososphaeria archaeon]MDW7986532.1 S1 RNA-binding domain-containing protein [Nitrososphaerota archaeon]